MLDVEDEVDGEEGDDADGPLDDEGPAPADSVGEETPQGAADGSAHAADEVHVALPYAAVPEGHEVRQ